MLPATSRRSHSELNGDGYHDMSQDFHNSRAAYVTNRSGGGGGQRQKQTFAAVCQCGACPVMAAMYGHSFHYN